MSPDIAAPVLSVIIPTYNRSTIVARSIEALARQNCDPGLYEVIVSDDGSTDDTRQVVDSFANRSPMAIQYLYQQNAGANRARNRAVAVARAPVLLLINDDTIATPDMLPQHLAMHARYPDDRIAVLGRVTVSPELPPTRMSDLHLDASYRKLGNRREHDWRVFFTCNVSVKKSLLERGGLFEERLRYHEDLELSERLSHHGLKVIYCREALGYHYHYLTEEEYLAIAERDAQALATWYRLAPHLSSVLGTLGFEPGVPFHRRIKHQVVDLLINDATIPFWRYAAQRCPETLGLVSRQIYCQIYLSVRRSYLRRELRNA
jgi:glycosyltransferase involved in cell wall biosynthesis